jgi:hypothetical protein
VLKALTNRAGGWFAQRERGDTRDSPGQRAWIALVVALSCRLPVNEKSAPVAVVAQVMEAGVFEMRELGDRWSLTVGSAEGTRLCFDWAVNLTVADAQQEVDVRLEGTTYVVDPAGNSVRVVPEGDLVTLSPMLTVLRRRLIRLDAFKEGRLELEFARGLLLQVAASEHFEPWQITGQSGLLIVSTPGAGLAVWGPLESS